MGKTRVEALIFAGGVGRRMGGSRRPKQFLELGGRPIIDFTIAHFAEHPLVDGMVVVCLAEWIDYLERYLATRHYGIPIDVIAGGPTGQESIFCGLRHLHDPHPNDEESVVLVHDGVRPLINAQTISDCVASVLRHGPTATVAPASETIIATNEDGTVDQVLQRARCGLARAPQGCRLRDLYEAHLRAREEGRDDFIDTISMLAHYGYQIHTVEGPAENIKVTTPMDYYAFKGYMEARDQQKVWGDA